jgi:hypothetical protein
MMRLEREGGKRKGFHNPEKRGGGGGIERFKVGVWSV